ncbi:MAG: zinc metallopeptidase [Lachnospiraceae bacterium]|jgi:Zn-dependent membrane protease YugP|nr:zinc metallopeptidase [Lachnospiraceae bacterium]
MELTKLLLTTMVYIVLIIISYLSIRKTDNIMRQYGKIETKKGISCYNLVKEYINKKKYVGIRIKGKKGFLVDNYNPISKQVVLNLTTNNMKNISVLGIGAFICGSMNRYYKGLMGYVEYFLRTAGQLSALISFIYIILATIKLKLGAPINGVLIRALVFLFIVIIAEVIIYFISIRTCEMGIETISDLNYFSQDEINKIKECTKEVGRYHAATIGFAVITLFTIKL